MRVTIPRDIGSWADGMPPLWPSEEYLAYVVWFMVRSTGFQPIGSGNSWLTLEVIS